MYRKPLPSLKSFKIPTQNTPIHSYLLSQLKVISVLEINPIICLKHTLKLTVLLTVRDKDSDTVDNTTIEIPVQ